MPKERASWTRSKHSRQAVKRPWGGADDAEDFEAGHGWRQDVYRFDGSRTESILFMNNCLTNL